MDPQLKLPTSRALIDPYMVLEEAGILQNMTVADLGVGAIGHFLFPAAGLVGPKGHVFGVDVLKQVLEANRSRAKALGVENIEYIWGDIEKLGGSRLPDSSVDLAILVNVYHATKNGQVLEEARRIMHSDGRLVIVEWNPAGASFGPKPESRVAKADVIEHAQRVGFTYMKDFTAGPYHYGLVFTKPLA